jgi:hypothetical protein
MNSPSASTGGSIRSTPSVPCSASRAALRHRPMQSFTPVPGSTLHLGGVGKNRIGKESTFARTKPSASRGGRRFPSARLPVRRTGPGCPWRASWRMPNRPWPVTQPQTPANCPIGRSQRWPCIWGPGNLMACYWPYRRRTEVAAMVVRSHVAVAQRVPEAADVAATA